uniref:NEDD8-activating enzyme E1 regulatory subunit n=1 Tax=Corethrella appendiculata TaxID=1370023 RepID=U5EXE7_9DIPT
MSSPAPKSPELSEKNRKYDRQIRLWGEHGQTLLENAQICLINASALGTEILKGIVLPGIGGFTIIDNHLVTEEDIGSNFFLESSSINQSRGKTCMHFLTELNPDVLGDYVNENVDVIIENNPEFFKNFDVIVTTNIYNENTIVKLSNLLWDLNIPLIMCKSVGFYGLATIQIREHCVIETHPDNQQNDLRLEEPFETLKEHMAGVTLTKKSPWLIVLYRYLEKYKLENDNKFPSNYKEKCKLRDLIRSEMGNDEENYEEAIKAVNSSFGGGKPISSVLEILNDEQCVNLNKNSSAFWILARAVKDFVNNEGSGHLPLPGVLPDMTADTDSYIKLQNVYRNRAIHDAEIVYRYAEQLMKELNKPNDLITEKDARLFCKEAASIALYRGTKISEQYEKNYKATNIAEGLEMPDVSLMGHYVALRAMEKFITEHGYIPGECHIETDIARIKNIASKLINEWGINTPLSDDLVHEIVRIGGAEIHSISAFLGGCISHEIIKIVSKQYKPFNNTFIYDATTSQTAVVQF